MFQRIALLKLDTDHATPDARASAAASLRSVLARGGFDASVGLPADDAAEKSWDVSLTVAFRTRAQLDAFDSAAFLRDSSGLAAGAIAVIKGWSFEV